MTYGDRAHDLALEVEKFEATLADLTKDLADEGDTVLAETVLRAEVRFSVAETLLDEARELLDANRL